MKRDILMPVVTISGVANGLGIFLTEYLKAERRI